MLIWRADANGKLGTQNTIEHGGCKIVGPRVKQENRKGKWGKLITDMSTTPHDTNEHMTPTRNGEKEKEQYKQQEDPKKYMSEINLDKLNTWISPDGKQKRQIDYIAISHKYRNAVTRTRAIQEWRGNMQQRRQHAVVRMDITLRLLRNYHKPYIRETCQHVQYDIEQTKQEREKLAKWYKQREKETGRSEIITYKDYKNMELEQMTGIVHNEWQNIQEKIHTGLLQCYSPPKPHEIQQRKQLNQQNQHRQWGTKEKSTEMDKWQTQKTTLQKELNKQDKRIKKEKTQLLLAKILTAWKYTKKRQKDSKNKKEQENTQTLQTEKHESAKTQRRKQIQNIEMQKENE